MKAAWLVPLTLCGLACSSGADGPRNLENQAGTAGTATNAGANTGGAAVGASGSAAGGAPSAGVAGAVGVGGAGASAVAGAAGGDTGPLVHPDLRTVVYLPSWRGAAGAWL